MFVQSINNITENTTALVEQSNYQTAMINDWSKTQNPPALILGGAGMIRSLGKARIPIIVGSDVHDNPSLYSKYSKHKIFFSSYITHSFIDELIILGKSLNQKAVFFADDDRAIQTFSKYRAELLPYYYFNLPDHSVVEGVLDKGLFSDLAKKLDLPVPATYTPKNLIEVGQLVDKIHFPCILKPKHREYWWHPDFIKLFGSYRKVIYCNSPYELFDFYNRIQTINSEVIVQEVIQGRDDQMSNIDMYLNDNSEPIAYYLYKKHRTYPIHAGIGCFVETIEDNEMRDLSFQIGLKLGMRGFCNIQFKRDSVSNKLKILEIHTRASIWGYLGTISGLNLLAFGYHHILGKKYCDSTKYRTGVKSMDVKRDLKALPQYLKCEEWTFIQWLSSFKGVKSFHLLSLIDPLPFFADLWFIGKRMLRKNKIKF